jgi:hypothetical protein
MVDLAHAKSRTEKNAQVDSAIERVSAARRKSRLLEEIMWLLAFTTSVGILTSKETKIVIRATPVVVVLLLFVKVYLFPSIS